jgi:hypothetical protein
VPTRPRLRPVGRRLPNVNRRGRRKGCHEGTIFGRNALGHAQQDRPGGKIKHFCLWELWSACGRRAPKPHLRGGGSVAMIKPRPLTTTGMANRCEACCIDNNDRHVAFPQNLLRSTKALSIPYLLVGHSSTGLDGFCMHCGKLPRSTTKSRIPQLWYHLRMYSGWMTSLVLSSSISTTSLGHNSRLRSSTFHCGVQDRPCGRHASSNLSLFSPAMQGSQVRSRPVPPQSPPSAAQA